MKSTLLIIKTQIVMTVYLLAGHNVLENGAIGVAVNGNPPFYENQQTIVLRDEIAKHVPPNIKVVIDSDAEKLPRLLSRLKRTMHPNDLCIEIHFNAYYSPAVGGCEVYVNENANPQLRGFAKQIALQTSRQLATKYRGVKNEGSSQYSRLALLHLPCNVILWEVCFCTSPNDVASYYENYKTLAAEIAMEIEKYTLENQ